LIDLEPPIVRVIAYTKFQGVPEELAESEDIPPQQDTGSDLARLVETAGRTCYDSFGRGRGSETYHQHILDVGHGSVLAHASISFYISNISRNCSHEWVRHAIGCGISQRSTRYCDESISEIVWHPLLGRYTDHHQWEEIKRLQDTAQLLYQKLVIQMEEGLQREEGVDKMTARKQARGAARGILPSALGTAMVWTANLRALRNVIEQRCHPAADWEIRRVAYLVFLAARKVCPEYFAEYIVDPAPDGFGYVVQTPHRKI
jgi:thymidylate synthase (FAD)